MSVQDVNNMTVKLEAMFRACRAELRDQTWNPKSMESQELYGKRFDTETDQMVWEAVAEAAAEVVQQYTPEVVMADKGPEADVAATIAGGMKLTDEMEGDCVIKDCPEGDRVDLKAYADAIQSQGFRIGESKGDDDGTA